MRTIWALTPEKQKQKANETVKVLIPIAHRLGINKIKSELEDLCLKYLKPDIYNDISEKLNDSREDLSIILNDMKENVANILKDYGLKFEIKGRVKSISSIYEKLNKGKKFNDIYDILALRIILEKESDCYLAVGLIHAKYRPMPKRFKDYIASPKENMYQSLHTTVFGVEGYLFEIQLRTAEMDEIAEKGIASHWTYKESGTKKIQTIMEQKLELFRSLIENNKTL
jgi:GTP pyrophosphokinase